MGDYKDYQFSIEMNDISKHNFYLKMTQTVTPRKCIRIEDVASNSPRARVNKVINKDTEDLVFDFEVRRIDGCADEYINKLHEKVIVETQPPIPDSIIKRFTT